MRQIVCLATSPWYPIPTRKQQVMSRIPDAEILYFDPSATIIAPLRDKHAKPLMTKYKEPPVHPQENITVYSLPPVLPVPSERESTVPSVRLSPWGRSNLAHCSSWAWVI